jgi:penicillin-binding protein 1B
MKAETKSSNVRNSSRATRRRHATRLTTIFRSRVFRVTLIAIVAACLVVASALVRSYNAAALVVDERLAAGYLTSRAGIYAAPRVLRAGQPVARARLVEALRRAGYVETSASNVWSGAFTADDDGIEIHPRDAARTDRSADALGFTPEIVRVRFDRSRATEPERITEITGDDVTLDSFTLEPELLTSDAAMKTARNDALSFDDIPPALVHAITAIEDRRFFEHRGLDAVGVVRAALSWTSFARDDNNSPARQGGSTITQQLVKNTYLTPERTLKRKFKEAMLAFALERRLSKRDIFALYCNEIYLGQRGSSAVRGVRQAARAYFNKDLHDLSLAEAATIAGMIQSPARYAPDRHADDARARRNAVISAMLDTGSITREDADSAANESIAVAPLAQDQTSVAPYFVDYVNRLVESRLERRDDADAPPARVFTTIDLDLQRLAESAVETHLAQLEEKLSHHRSDHHGRLQAALVALDPHDGRVLALVGGRNYAASQLNRTTDARRQPGSVFKPIVYAAAMENGISPVEMFTDAPREFKFDPHAPAYRPSNYGGEFSMRDVTMRTALVKSLNVVTVDLALRTGLTRVASLAASFGLPRPAPYPSLALGATEATPLEIAAAYTAFANGGARVQPTAISRTSDTHDATLVEEDAPTHAQVVRPSTAYMITDTLSAVLDHGTARAARSLQKISAAAGKTGTSRDGWFAGYTPNLVCVVWIGYDDNTPLGLAGADSALPVWSDFMRGALELRPELGGASFDVPAGINFVEIDPETGQRAAPSCPQRELFALTPALMPTSDCLTHGNLSTLLASADATDGAATHIEPRAQTSNAARDPSAQSDEQARGDQLTRAATPRTHIETDAGGRVSLTNDLQIIREPDRRR